MCIIIDLHIQLQVRSYKWSFHAQSWAALVGGCKGAEVDSDGFMLGFR